LFSLLCFRNKQLKKANVKLGLPMAESQSNIFLALQKRSYKIL